MTQPTQPHVIEGQLIAANALLGNLSTVFGPTCAFTASECPGGGWVIFSDGKPWAACTEAWEVPEIMGQVMAERFSKSFQRPERARDVTPTPTPRQPAEPADPIPAGIRPVRPPHMQHAPDLSQGAAPPNGASLAERVRTTAMLLLGLLAIGTRGLVGV